jgi:GH24 family phage-related lysozyme (muramidase)
MKNLSLATLSVVLFVLTCSCSNAEQVKIVKDNPAFSPTQKYQIMVWNIKKAENYRSDIYKCQAKKKTTGWGFTNVKSVKNIQHADIILRDMVEELHSIVKKEYPKQTYLQQAAIVSLIYNTGDLKGIKKSKFAKSLVKNDIDNAVAAFKAWNKVKIKKGKYIVSKGLVKRRTYEAKLLNNTFTMNDYNKLKSEISQIYKENRF